MIIQPRRTRRIRQVFTKWKGKIKEMAGKSAGIPSWKAKGMDEKVAGKIQKKVGEDPEKVVGK